MRIPFFSERRARRSVAAFFGLLALLGALMIDDYGAYRDGAAEQALLQENLKEYAVLLGDDDAVRYYDAAGVARVSEGAARDHGQAAYYLAAPILQIEDGWLRDLLWRLYTWCWFMAGMCALYTLCRALNVGYLLSCGASLMLYLTPRLFADGHYDGANIALLSLSLVTLALGARFLSKPSWRRACAFSLAGAAAANAGLAGLWAWLLMAGFALLRAIARRKLDRDTIVGLWMALCTFVLLFVAFTPGLWSGALVAYARGGEASETLLMGARYAAGQPLPRWYVPYMLAVTTPLAYLLLMAVGQYRACMAWKRAKGKRLDDERIATLTALTLFWLVPLLAAVLFQPAMLRDWRHFYYLYAGLCTLAGFGMQSLAEAMRKAAAGRSICAFAVCGCFLFYGYGVVANHAFQYAYYNSLSASAHAGEEMLDDRGVSTVNALRRLCTNDRDERLALTVSGTDDGSARAVERTYAALPQGFKALLTVAEDAAEASYLVANATDARMAEAAAPEGYRMLFRLESYGQEICAVYERVVD